MVTLHELIGRHARSGSVEWIGVRPARRTAVEALKEVEILEKGLVGDRSVNPGKRSVTLIQAEHIPVIASLAGIAEPDPALFRRNLMVGGINLSTLRDAKFRVGNAVLQGTGICAPCSRMEEALGFGGYNAMRGHGGITASVVKPGSVCLGDTVEAI